MSHSFRGIHGLDWNFLEDVVMTILHHSQDQLIWESTHIRGPPTMSYICQCIVYAFRFSLISKSNLVCQKTAKMMYHHCMLHSEGASYSVTCRTMPQCLSIKHRWQSTDVSVEPLWLCVLFSAQTVFTRDKPINPNSVSTSHTTKRLYEVWLRLIRLD